LSGERCNVPLVREERPIRKETDSPPRERRLWQEEGERALGGDKYKIQKGGNRRCPFPKEETTEPWRWKAALAQEKSFKEGERGISRLRD